MMITIPEVLTPGQVATLRADLLAADEAWVDGKSSAASRSSRRAATWSGERTSGMEIIMRTPAPRYCRQTREIMAVRPVPGTAPPPSDWIRLS